MVAYYKDKSNNRMFGQTRAKKAFALLSKSRELNSMFGEKLCEAYKAVIRHKHHK